MTTPAQRPTLVILAGGRARRFGGCKPLAPVGTEGQPVIDLVASDAVRAGIGTIVLVINPDTGPAIRYHVEQNWPKDVDVHFAIQREPLGTVHAVLAAGDHLPDAPFGVANADDLYGESAFELLVGHLTSAEPTSALVGFSLRNATIGDAPVTRGVCEVGPDGMLVALHERRQVIPIGDDRFAVKDGLSPAELTGDATVSMNLWGFGGHARPILEAAMANAPADAAEVLLPEMVGNQLTAADAGADPTTRYRVLVAPGRCIGVTHPDDLELVQGQVAQMVATGERPAQLWPTTG